MPQEFSVDLPTVEERFLTMLPEITSRASYYHRDLNPSDREEAVSETLAWSWLWSLTAAEKGRLDRLTPHSLVSYANKMFRSGRRFAGSSSTCVLSSETQCRGRAKVIPIDHLETSRNDGSARSRAIAAALIDSRRARPDEICRVDFDYATAMDSPHLPDKAPMCFRLLLQDNGHGHGRRIAEALNVSPPRVSQLKGALRQALSDIGYAPRWRVPESKPTEAA